VDAVEFKYAVGDPDVGFAGDLDVGEVVIAAEAFAEGEDEGALACAAGVEDGLVDVEENKFGFQRKEI
jgi:hypothetical protein